jgi:hypothetical protein
VDGRDGPVKNPPYKFVTIYARGIPAELKFLVGRYQECKRIASYSQAIRKLLETHPDLAKLAAELYTESVSDGPDKPTEIGQLR